MVNFYQPIFEIDAEFSRFSFQVSDEHYQNYKRALKSTKTKQHLVVWNGLVVDGHLQYRACREMDLSFTYEELKFHTRSEVIRWRCNQLLKNRILLTDEQTRYCIGKLYFAELDYGKYLKEHQPSVLPQKISTEEKQPSKQNKTAIKISKDVCVTPGFVLRASNHARAIDQLFEKCTSIAHAILNEDVFMSLPTLETLAKYPKSKLLNLELFLVSQNGHHVTMSNIKATLGQYHQAVKPKSKKEFIQEMPPKIKQMPVFDPNAAVSSLVYTMPSWVNIIERAMNQTDFSQISSDTRDKLDQALLRMLEAIYKLSDEMEVSKK